MNIWLNEMDSFYIKVTHFWKIFMKWSRINCHWDKRVRKKKTANQPTAKSEKSCIMRSQSFDTWMHAYTVLQKKTRSTLTLTLTQHTFNPKQRSIFKCFNNFVRKTFLINCRAVKFIWAFALNALTQTIAYVNSVPYFYTDDGDKISLQ